MTQNMETDPFNVSMRKFLKQVGVTSQRALEDSVRSEEGAAKLAGRRTIRARMVLTVEETGLRHVVEDEIPLG